MYREIVKSVVIAIVVAFILAVGAVLARGTLISLLGGATKTDLALLEGKTREMVEGRHLSWGLPEVPIAVSGTDHSTVQLGAHEICVLAMIEPQIANGAARCELTTSGGKWNLSATFTGGDGISHCQALCASYHMTPATAKP